MHSQRSPSNSFALCMFSCVLNNENDRKATDAPFVDVTIYRVTCVILSVSIGAFFQGIIIFYLSLDKLIFHTRSPRAPVQSKGPILTFGLPM